MLLSPATAQLNEARAKSMPVGRASAMESVEQGAFQEKGLPFPVNKPRAPNSTPQFHSPIPTQFDFSKIRREPATKSKSGAKTVEPRLRLQEQNEGPIRGFEVCGRGSQKVKSCDFLFGPPSSITRDRVDSSG